ncbi:PcfJ domain-containing protein [Sulfurimonas sp. SAG-AH-194-C21]|nr:PcfJ domain-containing protein [Sulfurimonas sp. SAG-AH-194-C21]MDF1883690.1 PcfJ domain-containing protein [Sulfurimonas sp. SAG-AH-194-C21]
MLLKYKNKNSWILSVENKTNTKYHHHYFCTCTKEFKLQTEIDEPEAPDILCPICGNDYFKDAVVFEDMQSTKIWKYFKWSTTVSENDKHWKVTLKYEMPIYNDTVNEVEQEDKELLHIIFKKDGTAAHRVSYTSKIISQYSLFIDDRVQPFKKLLLDEAKESLYNYVMMNKSKAIEWIDYNELKEFSSDEKLKYLTFFLKNTHLIEHRFFFWRMNNIFEYTIKHTTQVEMLNFIVDNRKEKSIKKALYLGYENSINNIGYYPYSDYIFSRSIKNIDLLVKLYGIHPVIKQHIFTDGTFYVAIEFIQFLKRYYTEKQIVKLFIEDMQDKKEHKNRLNNWRDTLLMLQTRNAFSSLEEYFSKVKLTTKKLHDEIVRVFHIVSYDLDAKENFEYDKVYLSACCTHQELEFKLPRTVKELSLWAKILHNCMFAYSRSIHAQMSIIYGVFRAEELLYAVELSGFTIVQAQGVLNCDITNKDMNIIKYWEKNILTLNQT